MTNNKKFNFPNNLLKQLDECSFGGYVLFNFSSKAEPQVFTKFDNQINAMALLYYLNTFHKFALIFVDSSQMFMEFHDFHRCT